MSFTQFTLERTTNQTRGIFNEYIYATDDLIVEVTTAGYFDASRFAGLTPDEWIDSVIKCDCSDGFIEGQINDSGTLDQIAGGGGGGPTTPPNPTEDNLVTWLSGAAIKDATTISALGDLLKLSSASPSGVPQIEFRDSFAALQNFIFSSESAEIFAIGANNYDLSMSIDDSTKRLKITGLAHSDQTALIEYTTTQANGATVGLLFGTQDPNGNVTAPKGFVYSRVAAIASDCASFMHAENNTNTGWINQTRQAPSKTIVSSINRPTSAGSGSIRLDGSDFFVNFNNFTEDRNPIAGILEPDFTDNIVKVITVDDGTNGDFYNVSFQGAIGGPKGATLLFRIFHTDFSGTVFTSGLETRVTFRASGKPEPISIIGLARGPLTGGGLAGFAVGHSTRTTGALEVDGLALTVERINS